MNLSFYDEESFKEAAGLGSLNFNNPPTDPDSLQGVGSSSSSSSSMPPQEPEDIRFDNPPSDLNIVRRVPVGSSGGSGITGQERSEDT